MAVKYLSGNRLWGTNAERTALSFISSSIGNVATCKVVGATAETSPTPPSGLGSNCINFDGTDDYLDGYGLLRAMNTAGSISFWFNADAEQENILMQIADASAQNYIEIKVRTDRRLGFQEIKNGTQDWAFATVEQYNAYGNWNHVVVTHDGTVPKIYLNGSLATDNWEYDSDKTVWWTAMRSAGADNFTIGCKALYNNNSRTDFFNGKMTNIAFWDVALTSSNVTSLYASGNGALANTIPTNQTAYFKCQAVEDGTFELGDLAWDDTAPTYEADNNNNGTIVNQDVSYIHGLKAKGAILYLKKVGTMTGTATVGVWEDSGGSETGKTLVGSAGDITSAEANALSDSTHSAVTRYFTERTLETNDTIALQCNTADGFGASNNLSFERLSTGAVWDSTNTCRNRYTSGAWAPTTAGDMHMSIITESDALVNYASVSSTYPTLPNGSIFITSDTNVHYMWNGTDTWNEVA